ncbi:Zn-dependent exopeptidase [Anaeromyces robustus]|uniref:Zn-dependent exopeptidase n=1 Tax=Anaeromyces robustus TaxID=1754192 RepID=A0A1Y1X0A4_9FUNG|nr:Zn-dependent exopeptidase [Anaeromyces robustus]|eukprot:ORX79241.1 Zn-dependent exopeptidase [Anaeromyces robustus]
MTPNVMYKFNIINMTKAYSQFKSGMQPLQYSIKEKIWRRNGNYIEYYKNNYIRTKGKKKIISKKTNKNKNGEEKSTNKSNDNLQKNVTSNEKINILNETEVNYDNTNSVNKNSNENDIEDNNENVSENENENDDNDNDTDIEEEIKNIEKEIEDNEKNIENDNNEYSDNDNDVNNYDYDSSSEENDDDEDTNINNKNTMKISNNNNDSNNINKKNEKIEKKETIFYYSTLSFTAFTPYENDCVYFSYHYPYTYSDLKRYLNSLTKEIPQNIMYRQTLCKTIMGNSCDLLTITDFGNENKKTDKPYILLTGRVHPGESNSSFIMEGLIDFLVSSHPKAIFLRQNVIFKIVPMLNPDGVILGSQRCNLAGLDLNRQWSESKVSSENSPTIYWTKTLWNYIIDEKDGLGSKVLLYCDFHGHSRKKNIFLYGCELDKSEIFKDITEKTFPNQMNSLLNYFDIDSCKYVIEDYKKSTARVVGYQELKTYYSYTLECSFAGYENKLNKQEHYHPKHLKHIGATFIKSLYQFYNLFESKKKTSNNITSNTSLNNSNTISPISSSTDLLNENVNDTKTI